MSYSSSAPSEYPVDDETRAVADTVYPALLSYEATHNDQYYELLVQFQDQLVNEQNACTHKSSERGKWGCVAMCKTHSARITADATGLGDADYHRCVAEVTLPHFAG